MKNFKRLLAALGAFLLIFMYIATLIFALISHPAAAGLFKASLVCTFIVPVLLYAYILVYKLVSKNADNNLNEE